MTSIFVEFCCCERGSVSTLAAVTILPLLLAGALLVDTGFAWIARDRSQSAIEAAAALSAMHRPPCAVGDELDTTAASAAFAAATGDAPDEIHVRCTADGVALTARIQQPTALFGALTGKTVTIAATADAETAKFGANSASGWRRS